MTHWFDSGPGDAPYPASIRLTGRRRGVTGRPTAADTFTREESIQAVLPNTGRVAISSWVYGISAGEWDVEAELTRGAQGMRGATSRRSARELLPRASWSWRRWHVATAPSDPIATRWALIAPLARIPAVAPGSWTILGVIGVTLAIVLLAAIGAGRGISVGASVLTSLVAVLAGLAGAKVWFAVLAPGRWYRGLLGGWAVDGFLVAAPIAAVAMLLVQGLPVGVYLDASTPGIFLAVAIGRVGCFITGCCAGRLTRGRFGLWSSDRRVGARRVPIQLAESGAGLAIAIVTSVLVAVRPVPDGVIFVGAFLVYALVRQAVLRARAEARSASWRRGNVPAGHPSGGA